MRVNESIRNIFQFQPLYNHHSFNYIHTNHMQPSHYQSLFACWPLFFLYRDIAADGYSISRLLVLLLTIGFCCFDCDFLTCFDCDFFNVLWLFNAASLLSEFSLIGKSFLFDGFSEKVGILKGIRSELWNWIWRKSHFFENNDNCCLTFEEREYVFFYFGESLYVWVLKWLYEDSLSSSISWMTIFSVGFYFYVSLLMESLKAYTWILF